MRRREGEEKSDGGGAGWSSDELQFEKSHNQKVSLFIWRWNLCLTQRESQ